MVDKAIDEVLQDTESPEELKKRKPKPSFRYLTNEQEIKAELSQEPTPISIMAEKPSAKIVDERLAVLGLGDIETIENVLKKHEASRKFKDK